MRTAPTTQTTIVVLTAVLAAAGAAAQAGDAPPLLELPSPELADVEEEETALLLPDEVRPWVGLLGGGIGALVGAGGMLAVSASVAAVVVGAAMLMPLSVPLLVASGVVALGLVTLIPGAAGIGAALGMLAALGEADPENAGEAFLYVIGTYMTVAVVAAALLLVIGAVLVVGAVLGGAGAGALNGCNGLGHACGNGCAGCGRGAPMSSLHLDPTDADGAYGLSLNPALGGMAGTVVGAAAGGVLAGAGTYAIAQVDPTFPLPVMGALVVAGAVSGGLVGAAAGGALGGALGGLASVPE